MYLRILFWFYNPLNAYPTESSNTLSVFDHFMGLALKGLSKLLKQKKHVETKYIAQFCK